MPMKTAIDKSRRGEPVLPRRRVESGMWPLYVFNLVGILGSSLVQIYQGRVPESVAVASPTWYDTVFMALSPVGSILVLSALFLVRPIIPSLQLERVGALLNATVGIVYVTSVMLKNGGLPASVGTWLVGSFAAYQLLRCHEITKAFGTNIFAPLKRIRRQCG